MSDEIDTKSSQKDLQSIQTLRSTPETNGKKLCDETIPNAVVISDVTGDTVPVDNVLPVKVEEECLPVKQLLSETTEVKTSDEVVKGDCSTDLNVTTKAEASDIPNVGKEDPAISSDKEGDDTELTKSSQENKTSTLSTVKEIVIIEKDAESISDGSIDGENKDEVNTASCVKVDEAINDDIGNRENNVSGEDASGEHGPRPQRSNGRRRGNRNRTKSVQSATGGARSDTDTTAETVPHNLEDHRNSYRRQAPFRSGRGRGGRRGRGRGGFYDGGMLSPPYRQNFGDGWNYGADTEGRYRQNGGVYEYRTANGNRDRPGYYAARVVNHGTQYVKSRGKSDEACAQTTTDESGVTENVQNNTHQKDNRRGRRRNYRNRTRSGHYTEDDYQHNENNVTATLPVEPKGRPTYYRYSYRPSNPRNDYYGQMHGYYHNYYYDGGYNRPYYGYSNGYGYNYGRGSNRGYNGPNRRGGYRPRNKSNANQVDSTVKEDSSTVANGSVMSSIGAQESLNNERSS